MTLQDVANAAGVMKMTVSNALDGRRDRLSESTLARVLEAVDRLGYVRSATARSSSANRSSIVSVTYQPTARTGAGSTLGQHDALFLGELELHVTRAGTYLMVHSTLDDRRAEHRAEPAVVERRRRDLPQHAR